jgi:hypothetical protein
MVRRRSRCASMRVMDNRAQEMYTVVIGRSPQHSPSSLRVIQFSVVCSIPPFAKGGEGGFSSPGRPEIPPAPLRKGERNEN